MKRSLFLGIAILTLSTASFAEDAFKGEAEAGAILVSGNSDSESYAAKANTSYTQEKNIYSAFGQYIRATANGTESALNWNIGARYDRELNDYLGVFAGHKVEGNVYAGYIQRDSTDLGVKYFLTKTDSFTWTTEAGYRYSKTQQTVGGEAYDQFARLYTELNKSIDKTLSFKYWVEYLPNMTESEAYQVNTEASMNAMLNSTFSLKLGYLLQYQNLPPASGKYTTTTTTMNLVAKF